MKIRRRRENYSLPSESADVLGEIVGKKIRGLWLGTRDAVDLTGSRSCELYSEIYLDSCGGVFFLSVEKNKTLAFYDDDFLGSIVVRSVDLDPCENNFFDLFEEQDRIGFRNKIKYTNEIGNFFELIGESIYNIAIYKLPDNFYENPIGYDSVGECVVFFELREDRGFILAYGVRGGRGSHYLRLTNWNEIDAGDKKKMTRIWSAV